MPLDCKGQKIWQKKTEIAKSSLETKDTFVFRPENAIDFYNLKNGFTQNSLEGHFLKIEIIIQ